MTDRTFPLKYGCVSEFLADGFPGTDEKRSDALIGDVESSPEARYEARESIALSFVAGLQRLPTNQRAALVLRDVTVKAGGHQTAYIETVPITVTNGAVKITFAADKENPEINGIEILPAAP